MVTNIPNLAGTGVAEVVDILSREGWKGLERMIMTWEASSDAMLMVLGRLRMVRGVGGVGSMVKVS